MLAGEPGADGRRARPPAADYGALVEALTEVLQRTVAGLSGRPDQITVAIDAHALGPVVRLLTSEPVEVWLQNSSFEPIGPLELVCGPLCDAEGPVAASVSFEPAVVDELPPRSSRAVAVTVDGPPGSYRGVIQARGAPGMWLPLEIVR